MKFALTTLYVYDMEKTLEFYNKLMEIPIVRRQPAGPGRELVFMGVEGEPNLEFISSDTKVSYSGFSIGFEVENLEEIKERLAAFGYPMKKEFSPGPNITLCFLDGPNGEEVELVSYR